MTVGWKSKVRQARLKAQGLGRGAHFFVFIFHQIVYKGF
jgi:hypothetical protein